MNKPRIFDVDALEVLATLADTRSFTETARLPNRSQSTILRFEEVIRFKPASRTTRSVLLKRDGEEMVRQALLGACLKLNIFSPASARTADVASARAALDRRYSIPNIRRPSAPASRT